ncbi:F0F1 ATP synthase subunit B [Candidatus Profftia sp. (ex Adelges kitamiensis)]|uniref:F0F1 ATP synthase subunit B n=1 Tax=Candidatus Profftia sp. (ex Adelges kitamiensis) TaxID=2864218 RepID=UPI001CE2938C|nr:F0F1 ATP synthase subunit B [Candidatus Profftia sp. (ex Adelges kitamiensis)]
MNLNATILGQTTAFILFVWFCMKYIWPPIIEVIERRQKEISDNLSKVEQAKKDLYLAQVNATEQLQQAKANAQIIIEQATKRKAQIINAAKQEANIERNKIVAQAQTEIDTQYKRAYEDLRKQIAKLAIAGAEKILEHTIDDNVNSKIIDKIVTKL